MGGCCCSSSRTALGGISVYYHHPRDLVENEFLSSAHGTSSAHSVCIADSNQETSMPDAYQQPNAVLLLVDLTDARTNAGSTENYATKNDHMGSTLAGNRFETADRHGDLTESDLKNSFDLVNNSLKIKEEISHLDGSTTFFTEDDVCPICLEEYDAENPCIITNCKHNFHLSCMLEWFERSSNCAVCDQLMEVPDMDLFDRTL